MKSLIVIALALFLTGCAGYTTVKPDGTTKTPAAVGVLQASAISHAACEPIAPFAPIKTGVGTCEPGDDACHNMKVVEAVVNGFAKLEYDEEIQAGQKDGCHAQVASETKEYFRAQATKYKEAGRFGSNAAGWLGKYGIGKVLFGAFEGSTQGGDTVVRELNVNAESGGTGEGGASGGVNQVVNVGPGSIKAAIDDGSQVDAEKPIIGDDNEFSDNDSPNTEIDNF